MFLFQEKPFAASETLEKVFDQAIRLYQEKKDKEAEVLFLRILEKDPTQIRPRQFLGLIYARTGREDESYVMYEEIIAQNTKHWGGHYGLGLLLKQQKNYELASTSLEKAAAIAPKNINIWLELAKIAELQNNHANAVKPYQMILQLAKKGSEQAEFAKSRLADIGEDVGSAAQVSSLIKKAEVLVKAEDFEAAIPLYEEAALLLPGGTKIRYILGDISSRAGKIEKAELAFIEAIEIDPNYLPAHYALGQLYEFLGRIKEAIESYERIFQISRDEELPQVSGAKEALFPLLDRKEANEKTAAASDFSDKKDWKNAEKAYKEAVGIEPERGLPYYNLAHFYHKVGQDALADIVIAEALIIEPDSKGLHLLSAGVNLKRGYYMKAMGGYIKVMSLLWDQQESLLYRKAFSGVVEASVLFLKARPQVNLLFTEGLRESAKKKNQKALSLFLQASARLPESPVVANAIGYTYLELGEPQQAYLQFKRAIGLWSGYFPARLSLARAAAEQHRFYTAITSYQRLLRLSLSNLDRLDLSPVSLKKEFFEVVLRWQSTRESTRRLFKQGVAAMSQGQYGEAINLFQAAKNQEPENKALLFSLGTAYSSSLKFPQAITQFLELLALDSEYPGVLMRLGILEEKSEVLLKAKQTYEKILKLGDKKSPEYKLANKRLIEVKSLLKQRQFASRHEKRGLKVLSAENPSPEMYERAIWDLQRAIDLHPKQVAYHYNMGLVQEKSLFIGQVGLTGVIQEKIWNDPHFFDQAIESYETALGLDSNYLQVYNRLARLYEALNERKKAIVVYERGLALGLSPDLQEIKDMKQGLITITKRLSGSLTVNTTRNSNLAVADPPEGDVYNALSLNFRYVLYEKNRLIIPLSYTQTTTTYFNAQTFFSSSGLGLGIERRIFYPLTYTLSTRYTSSFQEGIGLQSTGIRGNTALRYRGSLPNRASLDYSFSSLAFEGNSSFDRTNQNIGLSLSQNFLRSHTVTISHRYSTQDTPGNLLFNSETYRTNLQVQRRLSDGKTLRASGTVSIEIFTGEAEIDNSPFASLSERDAFIVSGGALRTRFRKNLYFSYGLGLT
ncbi:MAG: tetratricopeptide repeat protein, partial [Nitrospirota bacterium]|nr:tetratricopeptide repeat protein [Nitrospirota bacterium]